jgi:Rrf2 family iron-sulfur cluster assembly transcriptional regulator
MIQDPSVARLSSATLYATRAMIEIARADTRLVTSSVIEMRQQVPGKFLDQLLARMRRAGLIVSVRGPRGGYALRRAPQSISLADIVGAVYGAPGQRGWTSIGLGLIDAPASADCAVQEAWMRATAAMLEVMHGTTLDMLAVRQVELADSAGSAA